VQRKVIGLRTRQQQQSKELFSRITNKSEYCLHYLLPTTKPQANNVSQCLPGRTKPGPWLTYTENLVKFGHVVPKICSSKLYTFHLSLSHPVYRSPFQRERERERERERACGEYYDPITTCVSWFFSKRVAPSTSSSNEHSISVCIRTPGYKTNGCSVRSPSSERNINNSL